MKDDDLKDIKEIYKLREALDIKRKGIKLRTKEFGISSEFIHYIEMMEDYLLELEERVKVLELHK